MENYGRNTNDVTNDVVEGTNLDTAADDYVNTVDIDPTTPKTINTLSSLTKKNAAHKIQEPNRHWRRREVLSCIPPYTGKAEGK